MTNVKKRGIIFSLLIAFTITFIPYNKVIAAEIPVSKSSQAIVANKNSAEQSNLGEENTARPQDDFYEYVNGEWLKTAYYNINPLMSENSYISDLYEKSDKDVQNIVNDLLKNANQYDENSDEKKIINLYNNVFNTKSRNEQGIEPIKKYLDKIENVKTIDDLTKIFSDGEMDIFNNLFQFNVIQDYDNNQAHKLYIVPTLLGLGNADSYTIDNEENRKNKEKYLDYLNQLLILSGYDKYDASDKADNLIKFEEMVAQSTIGLQQAVTSGIDMSQYNVTVTMDELKNVAPNLNLTTIMHELGIDKSNKIVVQQMEWLRKFNELYTEENLPLIKNYIEMTIYQATTIFLTEDLNKVNDEYIEYLGGQKADELSLEEEAFNIINKRFTMAIGKLYAEKYSSAAKKQDVELLTKEIIEAYKKRIQNNTWISETTKANAIKKLNKISINIAYPDDYENFSKVEVKSFEEGGSLLSNMMNLTVLLRQEELASVNEPIKKTIFSDALPPQSVSAEYHFNINGLIIAGGILQPDFYKIDKTKEQKLATIGFVISHEVSHALDDMGAMYDSDGNVNGWWSEEDYNKFKEKTNKVIDFYNKVEVSPGKTINGQLTIGENIADISAMACLLDILEKMPNANYKEFFESYADGYRCARTKEYEDELLNLDSHSPYKFRVNVVLQQFEKFYETYGITEKDKMYVKPEDRVQVW